MPERPKPPQPIRARPSRVRILDELGRSKSLPAARADFHALCGGDRQGLVPDTLFLGLGPDPERLPELFPQVRSAAFLECPDLAAQLGPDWRSRIPAGYNEADAADLTSLVRNGARLLLYAPGQRLFPAFWGPLLAAVQTALFASAPVVRQKLVWLPGDERSLLRLELREAFEALGYAVRWLPRPESQARELLAEGECPELFFSVNFSGLDPLGESFHLLSAAGARVAVWCVDNPLHLLSGLKSRFWTALPLFVTDNWFVEPLKALGAGSVLHLPLAARARDLDCGPHAPSPAWADLSGRLVFVGRSAFPGKAGFFAGASLPPGPWAKAQAMLEEGQRPDFAWWREQLGLGRLWPGTQARQAGFCAEETGLAWRTLCLARAHADLGSLTVFGDKGWQKLLPADADLRGPVDYYAALPEITASAGCCLNLTSPLLPRGLTQRHFDAWAWGGLLVSDAAPGLSIFPAELTQEITFRAPRDLAGRFRALTSSPGLAADLKTAWRAELARAHTYGHRVEAVLGHLKLG